MNITREQLMLYAVTAGGDDLAATVEQALLGGATLVQLREKQLVGQALLRRAKEVKAVCDRFGVPLIINDDAHLALAVDAAGVHLGQGDLCASEARTLLGGQKIIGVTARTVALAQKAEHDGADYIGAGAVFSTTTKADAVPLAHATLREICTHVSIPVVAIGGIGAGNLPELRGTHIAGVAVVSSLFGMRDVRAAAEQLLQCAKEVVTA